MNQRSLVLLCAAAIAVIWQLPYGRELLYPLSLLATYAHEMGHGLAALLMGQQFDQLLLHADGSGQAQWSGNPGRITLALIAAGGLLGPGVAGMGLLLLARSPRFARALLVLLAALFVLSMLLWVRNLFGAVFVLAWAAALGLAARSLPETAAAFLLHVIAVTLCLSWFSDLNYMFSAQAVVNGFVLPSDSARIAQALWLPYWFWGAVIALFSLARALLGLIVASRKSSATTR
jgi:hypothetical protein